MSTMNTERPRPEYNCGMQDLYTVCEMVATTFLAHATSFEAYSTQYSSTTGTDLQAAVLSARALPGEAQRDSEHSILRKEMIVLKDDCLVVWQQLTSYIRDGFSKDVYQDQLNAAGHGYYASAQNEDWDNVKGLMLDGANYILAKTGELTAGGMPAGFGAIYTGAKDVFERRYDLFLQSLEASKVGTDNKVNANNLIYREAIRICEDGKRIFRKEPAIRDEFTFDTVLDLVRKTTEKHGVSGVVSASADGTVLGQADVTLEQHLPDGLYDLVGNQLTTNVGGFKFSVADGSYRITVSKAGFVSEEQLIEVDGGPLVVDFSLES